MAIADIVRQITSIANGAKNAANSGFRPINGGQGSSSSQRSGGFTPSQGGFRPSQGGTFNGILSAMQRAQQQAQAVSRPTYEAPKTSFYSANNSVENAPSTKKEETLADTKAASTKEENVFEDNENAQGFKPADESAYKKALRAIGVGLIPQFLFPDSAAYADEGENNNSNETSGQKSDLQHGSDLRFGSDLNFGSDLRMGNDLANSRNTLDLQGMKGTALEELEERTAEAQQQLADQGYYNVDTITPTYNANGDLQYTASPALIQAGLINPAETAFTGASKPDGTGDVNQNSTSDSEQQTKQQATPLRSFDQAQSFYDWQDLGALGEKYGQDFSEANNGYSLFRNLAMDNPELLADVFGYGDFGGIDGWRGLYSRSGVDLSDDATAVDNLSRYFNDNAANIYEWINNNDDSRMGYSDRALADAARWAYNNYGLGLEPIQYQSMVSSNGKAVPEGTFDADDFAQYALLSRMSGKNDITQDFSVDQINDIFGRAGENYKFGYTPEGYLGLSDGNGGFYFDENRSSGDNVNRYDMQNLLNANIGVTPYINQSNPLMDQYAIDTLLSMYNADIDKKKQSK